MTQFYSRHNTTSAIQWTGENLAEVLAFTGKHPDWDKWFHSFEEYEARVKADGWLFKIIGGPATKHAKPGDWIMRNLIGYLHVMPNDIFVDAYLPVPKSPWYVAGLEAACRFYGKISRYPAPLTGGMGDLWQDCGEIARNALAASPSPDTRVVTVEQLKRWIDLMQGYEATLFSEMKAVMEGKDNG